MLRIKSFAKINLGLEILGKRTDGYHELRTLFQSISLCDEIEIEPCSTPGIRLSGSAPDIPWDADNLIHRAGELLLRESGYPGGAAIHVRKRIPPGKGLGGGSSNAAVTLAALNQLWGLGIPPLKLATLAGRLGADVPYFLTGGLCLGTGIGDRIEPLEDLPGFFCVLTRPDRFLSTARVYARVPPVLTSGRKASRIDGFLSRREICGLINDLEETVFRIDPQLITTKCLLQELGAELSLLSGSGSAVFGLFRDETRARNALKALPPWSRPVLSETISRKRYRIEMGLGCSQVVRQRPLEPPFGGSNPPTPARISNNERPARPIWKKR